MLYYVIRQVAAPIRNKNCKLKAAGGEMKDFGYIDYTMASCPAPWSSIDEGELWLAGNYFMTLQKFPLSALALSEEEDDIPASPFSMPIVYPYALLVYHKIDRAHPKVLPIFALTIETTNYDNELSASVVSEIDQRIPIKHILDNRKPPVFFCMFEADGRYNFGKYKGGWDRNTIRDLFFAKLASFITFENPPKKLGIMADAFGNPETGVPAHLKENQLYSWVEYNSHI